MKARADAVPAKLTHHRIAGFLGVLLDRMADVAQPRTGSDLGDADPQAFKGDLAKPLRLYRRVADEEHAARVAVVAVLIVVMSILTMSPFLSCLSPGTPWQT